MSQVSRASRSLVDLSLLPARTVEHTLSARAALLLIDARDGVPLVVMRSGRVLGLVDRACLAERDLGGRVGACVPGRSVCVAPETPLFIARALMEERGLGGIAVVRSDVIVGIASRRMVLDGLDATRRVSPIIGRRAA